MRFEFYDVVCIDGPLAPDEVRGKTGHIIGRGDGDEEPVWGVWIYDAEMVWQLDTGALRALGYKDEIAANRKRGPAIRVRVDPKTGRGEIVEDT